MTVDIPALPPEGFGDDPGESWYTHYAALDTAARAVANSGSLSVGGDLSLTTVNNGPRIALPARLTPEGMEAASRGVAATTFYVHPTTGNDTRTGDTTGTALRTVGEAVRRAEYLAQQNDTTTTINLAAGTYTERVRFADFTAHRLNITIKGPAVGHPNVPTAVFTEGTNTPAAAILTRNPGLRLTVQDVRFSGYRGTASSCGINNYASTVYAINVHADTCYFGIRSMMGDLDVKGGIYTDCGRLSSGTGTGAGVLSLMLNRHAIGTQNAGNRDAGPIFRGCYAGVHAQESATGHVDWCTFEDNQNGVIVRVNARVNADGSLFRRNGTDLMIDSNGHVFLPASVTFGTGTDRSSTAVVTRSGGEVSTNKLIAATETVYGRTEAVVWGEYDQQTVTGTTGIVDILARTLSAPLWGDGNAGNIPPRRLRVRAVGTLTGTAGTKTVHLRLGAQWVSATFTAPETGPFTFEGSIKFVSPTRQVMESDGRAHLGEPSRLDNRVASVDMSVDQDVRVTVVLASATDSVTVETVELSWA